MSNEMAIATVNFWNGVRTSTSFLRLLNGRNPRSAHRQATANARSTKTAASPTNIMYHLNMNRVPFWVAFTTKDDAWTSTPRAVTRQRFHRRSCSHEGGSAASA